MIRRPPRSTLSSSSAASDVYKRQIMNIPIIKQLKTSFISKASTSLSDPTTNISINTKYPCRTSQRSNVCSCCQVDYNNGDCDAEDYQYLEFNSEYQKQEQDSSEDNQIISDFTILNLQQQHQNEQMNSTSILKQSTEFIEEEYLTQEEYQQHKQFLQSSENRLNQEYEKRKVFKQGFLSKKGGFFQWNSRFCIIKKNKLMYYKRGDIERLRGCIDFQQNQCKVIENSLQTEFVIVCGEKKFKFRGNQKGENIHEWVEIIESLIKKLPNKKDISQQSKNEFWRFEQIPLSQFLRTSQPLDIVLFRSKGWKAKVLRKLTGSCVDHVGIIVKDGILECFGTKGVSVTKFEEIDEKEWQQLYERVLIRKISQKNTQTLQKSRELLPQITQKVLGCKYGIKLWDIVNGKKSKNLSEIEQKQFFCSELVAEVLKFTKVILQGTEPVQCLPGCFEQGKKLALCSGFAYGNELMVNLE
eukprot:TRINITY_DN11150_c0_g1_i2.p1 TRINITY_DN11150_c0_g1~~TRINITY_DN11150_c0_g1_i2.p1  ORF type:complete len:471 (-),score=65.37 TRINITY_DN11150_c0_g1_i2:95-1507(-)